MFGRQKHVVVQVQASIVWEATQNPQTGQWLGLCRMLNLTAFGDTFQELQESANESMALLFLDLFQDGELPAFLMENGWRTAHTLPEPGRDVRFDVPSDWNTKSTYKELVPA